MGINGIEMSIKYWDGRERKMLAWNDNASDKHIVVITGYWNGRWMTRHGTSWAHVAEIPDAPAEPSETTLTPAQTFMTNFELSKWCATGKGMYHNTHTNHFGTDYNCYPPELLHERVPAYIEIMGWDDEKWHPPVKETTDGKPVNTTIPSQTKAYPDLVIGKLYKCYPKDSCAYKCLTYWGVPPTYECGVFTGSVNSLSNSDWWYKISEFDIIEEYC